MDQELLYILISIYIIDYVARCNPFILFLRRKVNRQQHTERMGTKI